MRFLDRVLLKLLQGVFGVVGVACGYSSINQFSMRTAICVCSDVGDFLSGFQHVFHSSRGAWILTVGDGGSIGFAYLGELYEEYFPRDINLVEWKSSTEPLLRRRDRLLRGLYKEYFYAVNQDSHGRVSIAKILESYKRNKG